MNSIRILVAEDDPDWRDAIAEMLESACREFIPDVDADVERVMNVQDALARLKAQDFDLLAVDMDFGNAYPGMNSGGRATDGREIVKKAAGHCRELIVVTGIAYADEFSFTDGREHVVLTLNLFLERFFPGHHIYYPKVPLGPETRQSPEGKHDWIGKVLAGLRDDPLLKYRLQRLAGVKGNAFCLQEGIWLIRYAGKEIRLPDSVGLGHLCRLLNQPGEDIHCAALAAAGSSPAPDGDAGTGRDDALEDQFVPEVFEETSQTALRNLRKRAGELAEDIREKRSVGQDTEEEIAELEAVQKELEHWQASQRAASRISAGGRVMRDPHKRSRQAVSKAIRTSIKQIAEQHPELGQHLTSAVNTGTHPVYRPSTPIEWQVNV